MQTGISSSCATPGCRKILRTHDNIVDICRHAWDKPMARHVSRTMKLDEWILKKRIWHKIDTLQ